MKNTRLQSIRNQPLRRLVISCLFQRVLFLLRFPRRSSLLLIDLYKKQEFTTGLEPYCFVGPEKLKLKLEFQRDTQTHKLLTSDTSGKDRKLEWSSVLGSSNHCQRQKDLTPQQWPMVCYGSSRTQYETRTLSTFCLRIKYLNKMQVVLPLMTSYMK